MADMRHPDDPGPRRTESRIQPKQNGAIALLIVAAVVLIGLIVWGLEGTGTNRSSTASSTSPSSPSSTTGGSSGTTPSTTSGGGSGTSAPANSGTNPTAPSATPATPGGSAK